MHNILKTYTHYSCLAMKNTYYQIVLTLADMVTCVFFSFSSQTHTSYELSVMMPLPHSFTSKPARLCLCPVQLCRLNISYTVFMQVVLAPPHHCSQVSPCAEKAAALKAKVFCSVVTLRQCLHRYDLFWLNYNLTLGY